MPDLNARYNLNDDGELIKYTSQECHSCVAFLSVDSHQEMVEHILAQQVAAWSPERDSPFKVLITYRHSEVVLSLILHEILSPLANEREILHSLLRAYSGDQPEAFPLKRLALLPFDPQRVSPVPGLRRRQGEPAIIYSSSGSESIRDNGALAMRWKTTVSLNPLSTLPACSGGAQDAVLVGVAVRFAQFIGQLSGQNSLALCLLQQDGSRSMLIDTAEDDARLVASVADKLCAQPDQNELAFSATETPWIYVRALSHADEPLEKQALLGQPILLPTYELRPDIELALEARDEESVTLVLTTGQAVYPSLGEFLLGRLASFLQGDENAVAGFAASLPADPVATSSGEEGANEVAAIILSEFRAALAVPDLTLTDDFFDYGGHSLLATRVIGRLLSTHGLEVHFGDFFSYPSAAALATRALPTLQPKRAVPAPQQTRSVTAPLALAQASLWQAYEAYEFGTIFNLPFALDLLDPVDETLLEQALTDLVARHPSLHTLFYAQNGVACQQVIDIEQLAGYQWFWRSSESQRVSLHDEAAYRFDLARELPIRIRLLHNAATGRQALSFLVHHLAIDEWSLNVMMEELSQAYASRAADTAPSWQKPALAFHEFALRQRAEGVNQQHLTFWTRMLRDATHGLTLIDPDHRPVAANANTLKAGWLEYRPQPDVTQQLYSLVRQNNASLFSVVYAAIALALHKLGNLNDITIGTSASGRTDPETYETVGYFTTMVAHRVQFEREKPVKALIADIRDTINNSMPYADIPLDIIQQSLGMTPEEGLIFDVYIQIHANNALNGALKTPLGSAIRYRQIAPDKTESMFGLQFEIMEDVIEGEKNLRLVITYRTERYSERQVQRISELIDRIFTFITQPESLDTPLARIPL